MKERERERTDQDLIEGVAVLMPGDLSFVEYLLVEVELQVTKRGYILGKRERERKQRRQNHAQREHHEKKFEAIFCCRATTV